MKIFDIPFLPCLSPFYRHSFIFNPKELWVSEYYRVSNAQHESVDAWLYLCYNKKMKKNFLKRISHQLEKDKRRFLKTLTIDKSIKIFESLTSSETMNEFIDNFTPDHPQSLKLTLKRRQSGIPTRSI